MRAAMATDSSELAQISAEAQDIAKNVGQAPATQHLLLALFTVPGAADVLLRERGCDEDKVLAELAALGAAPPEPSDSVALAMDRTRQLADDCGSDRAEGLHLLVALTRLSKSAAAVLLEKTAAPLASLRTTALGYLTGAMPRRRVEVPQPAPTPRAAVAMRAPPTQFAPKPAAPERVITLPPPDAPPASPAPPVAPSTASPAPSAAPSTASPAPSPSPSAFPFPSPSPATDTPGALDPRTYPWLSTHTRNLTALAATGHLDPAIGREREIDELLDILGKRRSNNPVLVGEPGVGKTAIVEGLAQRMLAVPDRVFLELDVSGLVAGTQLRGSFSERLLGIKDEVKRAEGRVVVFIDELHMLIGAGAAGEGPQDAANELKAALARGEFPCVGATTHDEFRKYIQGDAALERRFVPVLVREPSPQKTREILQGAIERYEDHHQVRFLPDALEAAARLTARYVHDRFLPDKAFAAIDLAGSRVRREGRSEVAREDVARAVARMAGLPEERLLQPDSERFLQLDNRLAERIVGHEQNLTTIARGIRRNYAGFSAQRPLASFLFCGPSGVGKTETARALADELFDGALVRIDLSEYAEPHTAARLVGAPPGYVGYGEGGQLTEAVRRKPASVVLLDEVEKAHPAVLQLLLQILDEGQLTDGRGRRIDFTAAVLVLTSNLGASAFDGSGPRTMGFGASPDASLEKTQPPGPAEHPQMKKALELARAAFPPELWSRLDERLVFAPLLRDEVARIAQLLLADSSRRLWEERRIAFRTGPGLVEHLIDKGGYPSALGARPLRQVIQRLVESPLADEILAGRIQGGEKLLACAGPGGVEFRRDEGAS
jgi:ATP-dependent Clp protease ATP-binding subunit ClpC